MNRLELAENLRKTADWLAAGFEVDRGGMTLADAIADLRQVSGEHYFCLRLVIDSHHGDEPKAHWETYGMTRPQKTFDSPTLAGLVAAVRDHCAEPATVAAVEAEVGRDASIAL